MTFPHANPTPPFNITRASHLVLAVADLDASERFYSEVIGLVVSAKEKDTVFLRGVEESAHHSLTLHRAADRATCLRLGFRVATDGDLDKAHDYFNSRGLEPEFATAPFQARTLRVRDPLGMPIEFVASMPTERRIHDQPQLQKGAAGLRFDHTQILAPNVQEIAEFYLQLGFRISDWFVDKETDEAPLGIFMYRKSNPHDIVFLTRPGPVLHHFAYVVQDANQLFRALDTVGNTGWASALERGPARHGEGHALYVYFRDPDGHRVEIMTPPIQMGDLDDHPQRWHKGNRHSWEYPAPKSWLYEASPFDGAPIKGHGTASGLRSLEDVLAARPLRLPE